MASGGAIVCGRLEHSLRLLPKDVRVARQEGANGGQIKKMKICGQRD
jgi:hypothetical protein